MWAERQAGIWIGRVDTQVGRYVGNQGLGNAISYFQGTVQQINAKENAASSCSFYPSLQISETYNKQEGLKQRKKKQGSAIPRKAKGFYVIIKKIPYFGVGAYMDTTSLD